MRRNPVLKSWRQWAVGCAVGALLAAGLPAPQEASAASAVVGSPMPPGAARIWFYRNYEPYGSRNMAPVSLNGALVGYVQPDGSAFYRDVSPGRYHVTVASDGTDVNQAKDVDLGPGQQAFVKILAATGWETGGGSGSYARDTFYVSLVPAQVAQGELSSRSQ